jgi:3-hydroxyisobutyrate dehydrogenase-like beta-hydroxyacid dehydrogenase
MEIRNVGVMSPGDMGQAVAMQIKAKGLGVLTALEKRSDRTRSLAAAAGLTDVGSLKRLVEESDVILSIMNPGAALDFAGELAQALASAGRSVLFVDCNAVSPDTMRRITEVITAAGAEVADGGIIGPPPRGTGKTQLFVSGPAARRLEQLATPTLAIPVLSERVGDASALKMCYGATTKGVTALLVELLVAGRRLGVGDVLEAQLKASLGGIYDWVMKGLPIMPPKAYRWVPEMHQIAQTFEGAALTPRIFEGVADLYEFVAATPLGRETPESRDRSRTGDDVLRILAEARPPQP